MNYKSLCRGCMCPLIKDKIVSMKQENIKNLFRLCTSLRIEDDDKLPKYLCRKCFTNCSKWKSFQEKCEQSQNEFNEIISDNEERMTPEVEEENKSLEEAQPLEIEEITIKPEILLSDSDSSDDEKFDEDLNTYTIEEIDETEEEIIPPPLLLVVKQLPSPATPPTGSKNILNQQPKYIFKCKICKQIYSNLLAYENHYKSAHSISYPCPICLDNFRSEDRLLNHQRITHTVNVRRESLICEACDQGFECKILYKQHKDYHISMTCQECNKEYSKYSSLQDHKKRVHGNLSFDCDQCGKTFKTASGLSTHTRIHSDLRPFVCHHCGKAFLDANGLKRHIKFVHELEAIHACHICPHKCKTEKKLAKHIELHTAEKTICCDICPQKFKTAATFKMHRLIHTGEKRFFCSICNEGFLRDCSLKLHMRSHMEVN